jgi:GT2 family glycosyltransferase/glycosyltransferase involved in cell wall biosynthesis
VTGRPLVSIVIPLFNKVAYTARCLGALSEVTPEELYEVVLVDNASTDATGELLGLLDGDVTIIRNDDNRGFTLACNQGAAAARGRHLLFLNNDTEPRAGWLEALLARLDADPSVGAVGARLVYPDGRLQEAGGLVFADGSGWNFGRGDDPASPRYATACQVDYCSGACLLVRGEVFEALGGFDERYAPAYYEDTDLCFAVRAHGSTVWYEPGAVVVHHEGATAGTDLGSGFKRFQAVNQAKFVQKWAEVLATQDQPPTATGRAPATADRAARGLPPRPPRPAAKARPAEAGVRRLLVMDPFPPAHDHNSGSLRLFELLKAMRGAGAAVTFVAAKAMGAERYLDELRELGISAHGLDTDRIDLARLLADGRFDLAWLSFFHLAQQCLPLLRAHTPATKVVVDTVDVHFLREQRQAELLGEQAAPGLLRQALETKRREREVYRQADALVAITDTDAAVLADLVPGAPIYVVPNVHADHPAGPGFEARGGLLFVGNFNHGPNIDAVAWLGTEILPRAAELSPDIRATVVGGGVPPALARLAGERLAFAGRVPSMTPYLAAARVSVAPLRFGAGMKGKVGEALAAGLPVVTTSIGAEGMGLVTGTHCLVADDADTFAAHAARLHSDKVLWAALAASGRRLVAERWSPTAARNRVQGVLDGVLGAGQPLPVGAGPALSWGFSSGARAAEEIS